MSANSPSQFRPARSTALPSCCPGHARGNRPGVECTMQARPTHSAMVKAGWHAFNYFLDTGECLFCDVDAGRVGRHAIHEDFCPLGNT